MTLVYLTLAWIAGIVIADRFHPEAGFMLVLCGFAVIALLINHKNIFARLVFGMLLLTGLGMLRFDSARPDTDDSHVIQLNDSGGALTLRGIVVAEPVLQDQGLQILVNTQEAAGHTVHGRVLVRVPRTSDVGYGDEVRLFGVLRSPPEFDTFSYRDYLARQKVFSVMYNADVELIAQNRGSPFYAALLDIKNRARRVILRALPEPQASLLVGMLLGDDSGLSDEVRTAFTRTGSAHIIAISGFNMVILAQLVMSVLRRLMTPRKAAAAGLAAIAIYTIFVGAGGAVVRAALMSGLLITAEALYRKTYVPASLAFAALLMSLVDPWVLWDVGFQLSFAAVIGMALFVRPLERFFSQRIEKISSEGTAQRIMGIISESVVVTLAAQITTTPLILYYFGRLSVVSLLVNFLIIPVQTPLLMFGALGTGVGLLIPTLGEVILQVAWIFLTWTVEVVQYFAAVSWAEYEISLSQTVILVFFAALGVAMMYQATRPRWAMQLLQPKQILVRVIQAAGVVAVILLGYTILQKSDGRLHVTFLGQNNAVVIESPRGGVILVDGGAFPTRLLDGLGDALPARTRHIDVLILTASDEVNLTAIPEVLDRYTVGAILTNGQESDEPTYTALLTQIEDQAIPVIGAVAGYTLKTDDGVTIEILNPPTVPEKDDIDSNLVLRLSYGNGVFLLPAGGSADTEAVLLVNPHLVQANVLQIPAHGSGDASSAAFVQVVNPQVAVLQVDSTEPSPTVIERFNGIPLFRTDQHGSIEIISDGVQLWTNTNR